ADRAGEQHATERQHDPAAHVAHHTRSARPPGIIVAMARGLPKPGSSRDTIHDGGEGATTSVVEALPSSSISLEIETDDGDGDLDAFGDLKPGAKLGRYQIDGVLGKGATGVVFLASHLVIGKRVALKCLYPQHSTSRNAVERFFREAKIAATVEHPNVIQV